jgi:hypothetical protein
MDAEGLDEYRSLYPFIWCVLMYAEFPKFGEKRKKRALKWLVPRGDHMAEENNLGGGVTGVAVRAAANQWRSARDRRWWGGEGVP